MSPCPSGHGGNHMPDPFPVQLWTKSCKNIRTFGQKQSCTVWPLSPPTHTHSHTHTHTHVCPRLLCRTLQLNPFLIFLAINFYHFGISLWNATPTRNHLRPLTIYVHNGFACVCQVKLKFFFFFFFCSHHEETSGQKRTEQVNFMVIINFMVSLKNIEERTEPENVKKKYRK